MMELQSHVAWDQNVPYQPQTTPFHPFASFAGDTGEPYVVVSFAQPFKIIKASQEWLDLFRFSREEVSARSIQIIQGPGTDFDTIKAIMAAEQEGKSKEAPLILYSSACQGRLMRVRSSPAVSNGQLVGCVLTMHQLDAVPYKQASAEDGTAKVIVGLHHPHLVEWSSSAFHNMYGFQPEQLQGRTLRVVHGPNTDHRRWDEGFSGCGNGQSFTARFTTCRHDCLELDVMVHVSPVYCTGAGMSHLLASFSPAAAGDNSTAHPKSALEHTPSHAADATMADAPFLAPRRAGEPAAPHRPAAEAASAPAMPAPSSFQPSQQLSMLAPPMQPRPEQGPNLLFPSAAHATSTPTLFAGHAVPSTMQQLAAPLSLQNANLADFFGLLQPASRPQEPPEKMDTESKVFPRRKQGQDTEEPSARGPVVITLEVLESFSSLSLTAAAAKLGISPTAVKKACRKLGVLRWPYRKNQEQVPESSVAQYDEAYVRKLYRKYSKASKAGPPGAQKKVDAGDANLNFQPAGPSTGNSALKLAHPQLPPPPPSSCHLPPQLQHTSSAPEMLPSQARDQVARGGPAAAGQSQAGLGVPCDDFGRLAMEDAQKVRQSAVPSTLHPTLKLPAASEAPPKVGHHVGAAGSLHLASGAFGGGSGGCLDEEPEHGWGDVTCSLSLGLNHWGT